MATEGQEIQDVPVEDTNPQQEEGGDDEVCYNYTACCYPRFLSIMSRKTCANNLFNIGRNRGDEEAGSRDGIRGSKTARDAIHP